MLKAFGGRSGSALSGLLMLSGFCASSAAQAQQILSVVESEQDGNGPADKTVVSTAGALAATTYGGADSRALTDFGVNKVYSSGNADYEQYATSAWLDSYTVGGATGTTVDLTFNFTVDGLADFGSESDADFNFAVYALSGANWTMSGYDFDHLIGGPNYERIMLSSILGPSNGPVGVLDTRDFDGISYYFQDPAAPGLPGTFFTKTNAGVLATAQLCAGGECPAGDYPGTTLSLNFSIASGSTFSLASVLFVDDIREGTVDFFNTAKVTGITLSDGATLTSQSGALTGLPGGGYGYPAESPPAVPEPASWAMLVGGLAFAGSAMRRRAAVPATV